ncbi:hypothetical protein [Pseudonocardia sp. ICBG601]|uniref:hypothetical protein n=1 Tax=Pseudonocardia sp. ICBG601 TaxID=2846759 RepID=UPI0035ABFAEF
MARGVGAGRRRRRPRRVPAGHPLLGAVTTVAGSDEVLLTGSLSTATHPWLASADGPGLLPATAVLELALHAAHTVGPSAWRS